MLAALLDRLGVVAEEDRTEILAVADGIADAAVDTALTAFESKLPAGGIKDVEWGPIRSAVLESLPTDDAALNGQIAALFDTIVAKAKSTGASPQT